MNLLNILKGTKVGDMYYLPNWDLNKGIKINANLTFDLCYIDENRGIIIMEENYKLAGDEILSNNWMKYENEK